MSDDGKNLSDDLDDMLDDAKDGAKRAGEKISQKASELANDAKEFAGDAKEKAAEFAEDAKEVLSDGKNVGIIAHLWWIGWIIAMIMNNGNKTEHGSFYIRQTLGLLILSLVNYLLYFISPMIGGIVGLLLFVLWIMSLIGSLSGEKKPVFLLGEQFQDWFKSL
ncbi:YtxH domain-containing protein [Winogradskyella echinorum]|uniref:YtxH domain-containing protein n=1 Tax=Winogradskyella echinorum TaxID=538189 RepID=A0ABR6XZT0_9FLAO|nr:YtxH domain-containing protein [Winogradskyella echinorum]MBC3845987.1 YtxH domain-containing protein [Winogradskyella echinorum]MBC5750335.1 YtxH domain-containing protein [Winogradskyella echinorum]